MGTLFPPLPPGPFDIIYADPPWDYKGQLQHAGEGSGDTGGAARHYPTVTLDDLKTLSVQSMAARDCLLFMWATNPHLDQAIDLGKAWGFAWATVAFVWDKERVNPGFYTMSQCELCLVFKRGEDSVPARRQERAPARHRQARGALARSRTRCGSASRRCSLFCGRSSCSHASRMGAAWPMAVGKHGGSRRMRREHAERHESRQAGASGSGREPRYES